MDKPRSAPHAIERIRKEHVRDEFQSGQAELDAFLKRHARQNDDKNVSRTYVAVETGSLVVVGYSTLRYGAVAFADLPEDERKRLPRYPVPVLHVGRLAVDSRHRGKGLGELLLLDALSRAIDTAEQAGLYAIEVIAKNEAARAFYDNYGFKRLLDDEQHLYLSLNAARKALITD